MRTRIRTLRRQHGLTMKQLGKEIGISSGGISDIENGKNKYPRLATLLKFADYFEVSLDDLIGRKVPK